VGEFTIGHLTKYFLVFGILKEFLAYIEENDKACFVKT